MIKNKSLKSCALTSERQISTVFCALICLWQISAFGQVLPQNTGRVIWNANTNNTDGYYLYLTSQNKSSNEVFTSYLYSNKLVRGGRT